VTAPLVLLRSPYGRGAALDRMPHLLAERGYQVLYVSLRGTDGSGFACTCRHRWRTSTCMPAL
jgi:dipeptidyl aminopeptidase/acylaminoacyl peptidase